MPNQLSLIADPKKQCHTCGADNQRLTNSRYCSLECRAAAKRRRTPSIAVREVRKCLWCEEEFVSIRADHRMCSDPCRNHHKRVSLFGISAKGIERLKAEQGGLCPACGDELGHGKRDDAIDHCHDSGKVRALVHNQCNVGIGFANEDIERLFSWGVYLARHQMDLREMCAA